MTNPDASIVQRQCSWLPFLWRLDVWVDFHQHTAIWLVSNSSQSIYTMQWKQSNNSISI